MSEKTAFLNIEEKMLRYDAAVLLRQLAESMAQGGFPAEGGCIAVGKNVKVECKGKLKAKDGGGKGSLKVEISWNTPAA